MRCRFRRWESGSCRRRGTWPIRRRRRSPSVRRGCARRPGARTPASVADRFMPPVAQPSVADDGGLMLPLTRERIGRPSKPFAPAPTPAMLTPSCLMMSRRISLIVTRRLTWSRPRMVSELITLPVSGVPDGATLTCIDAPPAPAPAAEAFGGAAQHRGADEAAGDVERLLRVARRGDRAHQDDRIRRPS